MVKMLASIFLCLSLAVSINKEVKLENLTKDLTTIGTAAATALGDPYGLEDLGTKEVAPSGVDLSSSVQPAPEMGEYEATIEAEKALDGYETDAAMHLLSVNRKEESMFTSGDNMSFEPEEYMESDEPSEPLDPSKFQPDPEAIMRASIESIKQSENPQKHGFKGGKFYPIDSLEGKGTLNKSGQEIGYGVLVEPSWLKDGPNGWPVIDGQQVDIRQGINERQAEELVKGKMNEASQALSDVKDWDRLNPEAKDYFVSFGFNAGPDTLKNKNSKAYEALQAGYPVEAMIKTFDYFNVTQDGKKSATRGLLNRRLNDYNRFAEASGVPKVVDYSWGDGKVNLTFDGKLGDGVDSYFGKSKITLRSKNMKESEVSEHQIENGVFK